MGQIAEDIIDGSICQYCLCWLGDGSPGFPRTCDECQAEEQDDE